MLSAFDATSWFHKARAHHGGERGRTFDACQHPTQATRTDLAIFLPHRPETCCTKREWPSEAGIDDRHRLDGVYGGMGRSAGGSRKEWGSMCAQQCAGSSFRNRTLLSAEAQSLKVTPVACVPEHLQTIPSGRDVSKPIAGGSWRCLPATRKLRWTPSNLTLNFTAATEEAGRLPARRRINLTLAHRRFDDLQCGTRRLLLARSASASKQPSGVNDITE